MSVPSPGGDGLTPAGVAGSRPNRRTRTVAALVELAPVALVVVAEAAWISVIAGLLQEFALRDAVLGMPQLAAFVALGIVVARVAGPRLGSRWPAVAFALVAGSGAIGWIADPGARAALGEGIGPALAAHPGGWLAGLAILRGFAHARIPLAEDTVANLLVIGIPGLALAASLGGLIGEPYRTRFLADSLGAAIVYVGAAVLALALTRLDAIGLDAGFDWRRNPPWLIATIGMLVVATVITVVVSVALGPMLILGLATGFDRVARRVLGFVVAVSAILIIIIRLFGSTPTTTPPVRPGFGSDAPASTAEQLMTIGLGGLLLLLIILGIIVLIAVWMRRAPLPEGVVGETRTIDPSEEGLSPRRRRSRFARRPAPTTAVEAYVALVEDLERHADVRRDPAETPAAHAARLRAGQRSGLSLDLLAADYALARYGDVALPAHEDRRAVGRWRSLRRRIPARPDGTPDRTRSGSDGKGPTADPELPLDLEPRRPF
jgi:uncharacterized membrane protein YidH (DUF202 family)